MSTPRADGRAPDELRPISFERDFTAMAAGSCLVSFGNTRVLCTASVDDDVPRWMKGKGKGWVTAEYSMLPGSSPDRVKRGGEGRQAVRPHPGDPAPDRPGPASRVRHAGPRRAPGHRRLRRAPGRRRHPHRIDLRRLHRPARRPHAASCRPATSRQHPLTAFCGAISVGVVNGQPVLDLPYVEDSRAEVDMNVVMTSLGGFVEVQGTAEGAPFSRAELDAMLGLAEGGINTIIDLQREMVSVPPAPSPVMTGCSSPRATPTRSREVPDALGADVRRSIARDTGGRGDRATTFEENALIKARALAALDRRARRGRRLRASRSTTSDGAPGIHSARWTEEADWIPQVLRELDGVAGRRSHAAATCARRPPCGPTVGRWWCGARARA